MKVRYLKHLVNQAETMTIGREYTVIGIEGDSYRIINDADDPVLYEPHQCEVTDCTEPQFWVEVFADEEERYVYPEEWNKPGFFEEYHDVVPSVVEQFWSDCKRLYNISKTHSNNS